MVKKYKTQLDLKKRKGILKKNVKHTKKNLRKYLAKGNRKSTVLKRVSIARSENYQRTASIIIGLFFVVIIFASLGLLSYIKNINSSLPSPDEPFKKQDQVSIVYTDDDVELYRMFDEENREYISLEEVPEHVKWAFLAAEDVDFYNHPGFDIAGIIKAMQYEFLGIGERRGGSTITQQLIKQTALSDERTIDRKLKEILMSVRVEQVYSKDEVFEMYLNVSNFGSNVYGLKTASRTYFDKDVSELTLAEAAVLARIPQNPAFNSPTLSLDAELGLKNAENGKVYVLSQMRNNLDKINSHIEDDEEIILTEEINSAFDQEIVYEDPKIDIRSPHFVFYVKELLLTQNYNNGEPFTIDEVEKGGLRIYTTMNYEIQKIAQQEVLNGTRAYAEPRNGRNGAVVITDPKTGDVLAMIGSKKHTLPGEGKKFNPQVNITTSFQSMGSSMKPFGYYKAFEMGTTSPGSYLPDVPIRIGSYQPKNWDLGYKGTKSGATPRSQLVDSRNTPAVMVVDSVGVKNYVDTLVKFGYSTIERNRQNFGHSLVLGGGDVNMVEHAQAYGVFANGGDLVRINPINKITKYDPDTGEETLIYEKEIKKEAVADQRAVYMVNHILNYKNNGPGAYIDGRDHAGKTGTTENHRDAIYVGYTPEFVVVGWNGNNDNKPMYYNTWGVTITKPWVTNLSKRVAKFFPEKETFIRPSGLTSKGGDLVYSNRSPLSAIQTYNIKYLRYSSSVDKDRND